MGCPSTHKISGSGTRNVAYYSSRRIAESYARSTAESYARILAGLKFNGFYCPDPACSEKSLKFEKVTITSVSSSWSLTASFMWWSSKYSGTAEFTWEATITCKAKEGNKELDIDGFIKAFKKAVKKRSKDVWTLANGKLGNFFTSITLGALGDGCVAWALWVHRWVISSKWFNYKVHVKQAHIGNWPGYHQIVIIYFPNGTELVLDPWRDKEHPVYRKDVYNNKYGPIKDGFSQ